MKQEKGSALIMTILLVAVLGVIALGTSSAVNHNYKLKQKTLSSEKINYTATSAAEYSHAYITKLLNTTFTYTMYYNSFNSDDDNWKELKEDETKRANMGLKSSFCTEMSTFEGVSAEFGKTKPDRLLYSSDSDYEDDFNAWKEDVKKGAIAKFDNHLKDKLYRGKASAPAVDSRTCKPTVLLEDLQASMDQMCLEMNSDFQHGVTGAPVTIHSIKVRLPDFDTTDSEKIDAAEKSFIDDGYLHVEFTIDMLDQTIIQSAKFKWDVHSIIYKFCDLFTSSYGDFQDTIKVKVYYDKPTVIYK